MPSHMNAHCSLAPPALRPTLTTAAALLGSLVSGVLSVVSATELRYRAIYSTDGGLADELTITQPRY